MAGVVLSLAGCASNPPAAVYAPAGTRFVQTHLGSNARVLVDGRFAARDGAGRIALPAGKERQVIRVEEPRKPALVLEMQVLVDPKPEVEDRTALSSAANIAVVYTGKKSPDAIAGGPGQPVDVWTHPLALVRDADGPFFLPAQGQGVVVLCSDAGAKATVDDQPLALRPSGDGPGKPSLPASLEVWPGKHRVKVTKAGARSWSGEVMVRGGEYALVWVRLANEGQ